MLIDNLTPGYHTDFTESWLMTKGLDIFSEVFHIRNAYTEQPDFAQSQVFKISGTSTKTEVVFHYHVELVLAR